MITAIQVLVAILVAYIAWENHRINKSGFRLQKDKLRLDLFDRRMKVFGACQELFSLVSRGETLDHEELYKFTENTANAEFLFGSEIRSYVNEINENGLKLIQIQDQLARKKKRSIVELEALTNESAELKIWFSSQFEASRKIFKKYLQFSIYKVAA